MAGLSILLSEAGVLLKAGRKSYWDEHDYAIRYSTRRGKPEAGLWFRTRGCRHDSLAGGCVMCNYGAGPDTGVEEMIEFMRRGLDTLPEHLWHLLVSPLGSFLDEWEVPAAAREEILRLMGSTKHDTFSFESRAETVVDAVVEQCCLLLGNRPLKVYVGLESMNHWVSKYCVNKGLSLDTFKRAIQILAQHGAGTTANVLLGAL